jgi:hypothetical protein
MGCGGIENLHLRRNGSRTDVDIDSPITEPTHSSWEFVFESKTKFKDNAPSTDQGNHTMDAPSLPPLSFDDPSFDVKSLPPAPVVAVASKKIIAPVSAPAQTVVDPLAGLKFDEAPTVDPSFVNTPPVVVAAPVAAVVVAPPPPPPTVQERFDALIAKVVAALPPLPEQQMRKVSNEVLAAIGLVGLFAEIGVIVRLIRTLIASAVSLFG